MESSRGSEAEQWQGALRIAGDSRAAILANHEREWKAFNAELRKMVNEARDAGLSMEEIAEALGVSRQRAYELRGKR